MFVSVPLEDEPLELMILSSWGNVTTNWVGGGGLGPHHIFWSITTTFWFLLPYGILDPEALKV